MRAPWVLFVCVVLGCGDATSGTDAGPDAREDAGRSLRDAGCGAVAPTGPGPECVLETCFGGLTCVNGPCPEPCCSSGRLESCDLPQGSECAVAPPMDCGEGTCVEAGEICP